MVSEKAKHYMKLSMLSEVGAVTAMKLVDFFGGPEEALRAGKGDIMRVERIGEKTAEAIVSSRARIDADEICRKLEARGGTYICIEDAAYPKLLKEIADPPVGFYCLGTPDFSKPCISIIGSRKGSVYGQSVARKFGAAFAHAGFNVVSGMARGIDTAAHLGALEAGGMTTAVFGCGVDVVYPPENVDVYKKIISQGVAVSEFPMGCRADRQNFPIRNRIIAGMSVATIVVESDSKGGSMITARLAGEYGRDVFAVPGRIDQPTSKGCHDLIRDGATLITSVEDVLESLSFSGQMDLDFSAGAAGSAEEPAQNDASTALLPDEKRIYDCLASGELLNSADLQELTGLRIGSVMASLTMLELKKLIAKRSDGYYEKKF